MMALSQNRLNTFTVINRFIDKPVSRQKAIVLLALSSLPNHTFYVNGQWVLASEIKIGDKMLDCDNNVLVVENIQSSKVTDKVYNFEVEDNHNYFVTDLNILVHNDSGLDSF